MSLFAVVWEYTSDGSLLAANKVAHGAFVKQLAEQGVLLEAGAWADGSGALLIVRAESVAEVDRVFASDPYIVESVVTGSTVHEWAPVLSPLVD